MANVIVDGSGGGDYTTIDAAIEQAATGSVILIKDVEEPTARLPTGWRSGTRAKSRLPMPTPKT
jgi:hypothetical protein